MTNTFDKESTMFLVDFETNTIINYGKSEEMVTQMDESHGNLFVVDYNNLTEHMKIQYAFSDMLEETYKEDK